MSAAPRKVMREGVRKVVVVGSKYKPAGQDVARAVVTWLERAGIAVVQDIDGQLDLEKEAGDADLAISVGGDGTILATARSMGRAQVPTLGINLGKLGFLAEFTEAEIRDWIAGRAPLDLEVSPRMRLRTTVHRVGVEPDVRSYALNDAAVQQGLPTRLLTIDMAVDGTHATSYRADGLVIAGPVGSTAYSLSLGGPILTPGVQAFVVTPIAPHALTNRPIVVSGEHTMKFTLQTQVEQAALVLDGHIVVPIEAGSSFEVTRAKHDFLLVTAPRRTYYDLLKGKLGWGEVPKWQAEV